ncbi:MAG: MarR family winged helix-turn-helix transcriptional regulator [Pseudonocardia sp.]|nr:MarR family winged helix-turn-helix transcriptional regulator [Pseudonocardia sp.]
MVGEPPDLDGRLADAVERLGDAARAMLRRSAAAEGLSPTQAQLLLRITSGSAREGTGALAGWLGVSAPTVSDALRTLAGKGVVDRGHPPEPRAWTATPHGLQVARRLRHWRGPLLGALHHQATERKAEALASILQVIAELNLDGHISTARTCLTCRFFRGEPAGEGWCTLLDTALSPATLRVDCPEHRAAAPAC